MWQKVEMRWGEKKQLRWLPSGATCLALTRQELERESHPTGTDPAPHIGLVFLRDISETKAMNRTLVSPYFRSHPCVSFFYRSWASYIRKDPWNQWEAGHLLPTTQTRVSPLKTKEEASSIDCKERLKLTLTVELVAVLKSGGSDGASSRFSTLDLEVSPLGFEVPRDGRCQSGDASNMMEPMGPSPEPPTSLNLADIASKEDASPAIEREESPVRPPPTSSTSDSLAPRRTHL